MTHTVRLTIWPDRVLDISEAEHLDLSRRGMVLENIAPTSPAPAAPPPVVADEAPQPVSVPEPAPEPEPEQAPEPAPSKPLRRRK